MRRKSALHNVAQKLSHTARLAFPQSIKSAAQSACLITAALILPHTNVSADIGATHDSVISEFASFNTPGIVDGRVEAIAIDGDTVYVGGTFTQIHDPLNEGVIINQAYLFAYSKSTGNIIQSFDPQLNNEVLALETTGDPQGGVFAGGIFGNLNGETSRGRFAKIDINGDRVVGFDARPDAAVKAMVRLNDTLYIGGNFGNISSTPIERLAAIDTTTGAVSPNLNLDFGGLIYTRFVDQNEAVQGVDDIDITSDGQVMVIIGNFETIDGISRPRLALLELDGHASVSNWNTNVFDIQCPAVKYPVYVQGIDIDPTDTYLVTGSTGYRIVGNPACDTIARYEIDDLTNTDVQPTWVNFTGGDSVFEVVTTGHTIYAGGHFRWLTNGTDLTARNPGPGSVPRRGLAAIDPLNGLTLLNWRADRNPRGVGVFSMISEPEGLYLGDDTDFINGTEHRKLKFLPISSNVIERPEAPSLPTSIITPDGDQLAGLAFDGTTIGTQTVLSTSGWSNLRGGVFVGGKLFYADSSSRIWMSVYANGAFQTPSEVDLLGLTDNEWDIDQIGGMFFDYGQSRIYYTIRGDSQLYWTAFTPAGPYFGNESFVADVQADITWGDIRGMDVVDGHLYFKHTDSNLYRADIQGKAVVSGTTTLISGPGVDGRDWDNSNDLLAFLSDGATIGVGNAQHEFESSGTDTVKSFQTFEFPVVAGEEVILRLEWDDPNADLSIFVRDSNDTSVATDNTSNGSPKWLIVPAGVGGTYTASVKIQSGNTNYNLRVNPFEAPPEPLADFEFSSSGSVNSGKWQVFSFNVNAGELIEGEVLWDDPTAEIRIFLRDENGTTITKDTDGSWPAMVSTIAETSGDWSMGVSIASGSTNYDVLVNTTTDFTVSEPRADFDFVSSGTDTVDKWQVFSFDVVAGELIEAEVTWDDPTAEVKIFLRDETNSAITNDTDGGLPATVSAIAETSGQWSIGVRIVSGSVNYDVLVNTTADFTVPEPRADFDFVSSGSDTVDKWQVFKFDVIAGELIEAEVSWDDPAAEVKIFLRDETGAAITNDTDGGLPAMVSAVAGSSGQWSIGVRIVSGTINYDVLVNTN